jgi:RNA polymerase sigma factor (sigma-70 family)
MNRTLASDHEVYNDYARQLIRMKARHLARRADFSRSDEEDLAQDLTLHLLNQAAQFDPTRATVSTFVSVVIDSGVRMLLRRRSQKVRKPASAEIESLDTMVDIPNEPPVPHWSTISASDLERRTGNAGQSESAFQEEQEAFNHVLGSLPAKLRRVCFKLMHYSPTAAASKLHISRRKLRGYIATIREHFVNAGLDCE